MDQSHVDFPDPMKSITCVDSEEESKERCSQMVGNSEATALVSKERAYFGTESEWLLTITRRLTRKCILVSLLSCYFQYS